MMTEEFKIVIVMFLRPDDIYSHRKVPAVVRNVQTFLILGTEMKTLKPCYTRLQAEPFLAPF